MPCKADSRAPKLKCLPSSQGEKEEGEKRLCRTVGSAAGICSCDTEKHQGSEAAIRGSMEQALADQLDDLCSL